MTLRRSNWRWLGVVLLGTIPLQAQEAEKVVIAEAVRRDVALGHVFVGTVAPWKRSIVGSAVAGRVIEFPAQEGQTVRVGEPLARLRTETLEIQRDAAQAELTLRKSELEELRNGSLPEEIEQAAARMKAARAALENAQQRYERILKLQQTNAASQVEMDDARATAEQAEQLLRESTAQHTLVSRGPRLERIAQAEARVLAQEQALRLLEDQIERHTIVAPFDGHVTREYTEVGQWVEQGGPIAEVIHLEYVEVRVAVLASQASLLHREGGVRVTVPDGDDLFDGQITGVVPQADDVSRTVPVTIQVENRASETGPTLKAGMLVQVELKFRERSGVLMVPKDALVLSGGRQSLFVVRAGVAEQVEVETGISESQWIEVRGDLQPGEQVVTEGNERLRSGQKVVASSIVVEASGT